MTAQTALNQIPSPPRIVAISGIVFSGLFIASLVLIRLAAPADPKDPGVWLSDPALRNWVLLSLNLVPFTGIAFLWFMAVLRNHIGLLEDRFFATVFLGSGMDAFASADSILVHQDTYQLGRSMAFALMNTFCMKMAAVFMFVTSTIGLRTAVLSHWLSFVGFSFGLVLLLVITDFAWIALLLAATWVKATSLIEPSQTSLSPMRTKPNATMKS